MARFCTYCGKPLPESGQCDCEASAAAHAAQETAAPPASPAETPKPAEPAAQAAPEAPAAEEPAAPEAPPTPEAPPANPEPDQTPPGAGPQPNYQAAPEAQSASLGDNAYVKKTKAAVGQTGPFVKEYLRDPAAATLRALREKNRSLAVVLMVANAVVTGLLLFVCYARVAGEFREILWDWSGRVSVEVPFFSMFLLGIVLAAVVYFLAALGLFALMRLLKVRVRLSHAFLAMGVNSVFCTVCLVLALILAAIGWAGGVALALLLTAVVFLVTMVLLATKVFGASAAGRMLPVTALVLAVVLALSCWLGSRIALGAGESIRVDGYRIGDAMEDLMDLDVEDILGSLMGVGYYW